MELQIKYLFILSLLLGLSHESLLAQTEGRCVLDSETYEVSNHRISGMVLDREVLVALPEGKPPKNGWPVVVYYQGSYFSSSFDWGEEAPFGGFYESQILKTLASNGFAVVVPRAFMGLAWKTNTMLMEGFLEDYNYTDDYVFLKRVFSAIEAGDFGPMDSKNKFAAGMSSGGYNTSRMALNFAGEFKAFAIHSAAYATSMGDIRYRVPEELPEDHPPTFFIHGEKDMIVPVHTMYEYLNRLKEQGYSVDSFVKKDAGHEYFEESPKLVLGWFKKHLSD